MSRKRRDGSGGADGQEDEAPVPLYVITGGRSEGKEDHLVLDLVTLVVSRSAPSSGMHPEQAAILRMCGNPLSVAEISAYIDLPFSAVNVLLADLVANSHVEVREARSAMPQRSATDPDIDTLKALIDGLQRL
ncbi:MULTISPECIES: DUF742 domain-containing protein [Streptomyces]|uniref:Uncharacterized protein n=3 Tax=Streptomyces TaxID=1883 RepID=A0A1I6RRT1_9ACTN|nr:MULTISPECIES: DUF742 domain-containing protein [Streptomyces]MCK1814083.1 DUF742 domain-containing protein [Streptomyces sp. XM4011]QKV68477.1 DUF742 domain-containing protein [Streptomyces harbinensis]UWM48797.1 DUF742 domain-containing protein [Streptomyces carpaticus]SFS67441.1 Protein of unknown function [Streptomyces harbinensis]